MPEPEKKKKLDGRILQSAVGALDRPLRQAAEKLARSISKSSWVWSASAETLAGVMRGFLEAVAKTLPSGWDITLEKVTDFIDFFYGAGSHAKTSEGPVAVAVNQNWVSFFFETAQKRVREAQDPMKESERIIQEFEELAKILQRIDEVMKPKAEAAVAAQPGSVKSFWQTIDEGAKKLAPYINEFANFLEGKKAKKRKPKKEKSYAATT